MNFGTKKTIVRSVLNGPAIMEFTNQTEILLKRQVGFELRGFRPRRASLVFGVSDFPDSDLDSQSCGSSSPSTGGFPFPARSRMRKVSARSARRPLSRKYSSVRKAETFSATATLIN